jgi:hypothetical protein
LLICSAPSHSCSSASCTFWIDHIDWSLSTHKNKNKTGFFVHVITYSPFIDCWVTHHLS